MKTAIAIAAIISLAVGCRESSQSVSLSRALVELDAKLYSVNDVAQFSRRWMTLPGPPMEIHRVSYIGAILFRPGTVITSEIAENFVAAPGLKIVDISSCEISDDFFDSMNRDSLEFVFASNSNLSDSHCKVLSQYKNLKLVVVEGAKVSSKGVKLLRECESKPEVSLWFTD